MTGDQNTFLTFPPDAGQVCFKGSGEIHCLSYGAITSPIVASGGNQHAAKPPDGMSLQRCPGKRVKLRLRLKRKSKRAVKAAMLAGRKLKAKIVVVGTDRAGNRTTKRKTVRLKR